MATSDNKLDKKLKTLAQLALQLKKTSSKKPIGVTPSDEELTALYENTVDATRRAQILGHIANSSVVHDRWIRCVESLTFLEDKKIKETTTTKSSRSILDILSNLVTPKQMLGGGLSAVIGFVIVLSLLPQQNDINIQLSLNDAYSTWGGLLESEWDALPADQKPTPVYSSDRSFFTKPKVKSIEQQVLETGFKITLKQIGTKPFKNYGITNSSLSSISSSQATKAMTEEHYIALIQTGQVAALAAIQCKLDSNNDRLKKLLPTISVLRKQLIVIPGTETKKLVTVMNSNNTAALCLTAETVVELIIKSR